MKKGTIILVIFLLTVSHGFVFAQNNLETELEAKRKAKEALELELRQDQLKLDAISAEKNTIDKAVKELDYTQKKLGTEVKLTESKIGETETHIKELNNTIRTKEEKIVLFKQTIGEGIRNMHEEDSVPFMALILSKGSVTGALEETDLRIRLNKEMGGAINDLLTEKEKLLLDKTTRELKKEELLDYKGEVIGQKSQVDANKQEKTTLLNQTKAEEAAYQKIVAEKKKLQAQFEAELSAIEAKMKFNLDPTSYPKPAHGILAWPREDVLITQGFGLTESSYKLYNYRTGAWKGKHAGVDFRANNDKVLAMADGVVVGSGNTDQVCPRASTGVWVLLKYDNGLASTFFHLSSVVVKTGDRVKTGQTIAYSGNTGYSTAPHLHVGVMPASVVSVETWPSAGCPGKNYTTPLVANSFYLNPLDYLPAASDNMFKENLNGE